MKPYFLFDFDGVVVNSYDLCLELSRTVNKLPDLTHDTYRGWFNGNVYKSLPDENHAVETVPEDHPFFVAYNPRISEFAPVPGMREVLETIRERTLCPSIVSSTLSSSIKRYLADHDMLNLFERVYGADVGKHKVPKMRQALADAGRTAEDTSFVTDTLGDLHEATVVGMRTIAVTWGFHPEETLRQGSPTHLLHSADEFRALIETLT